MIPLQLDESRAAEALMVHIFEKEFGVIDVEGYRGSEGVQSKEVLGEKGVTEISLTAKLDLAKHK